MGGHNNDQTREDIKWFEKNEDAFLDEEEFLKPRALCQYWRGKVSGSSKEKCQKYDYVHIYKRVKKENKLEKFDTSLKMLTSSLSVRAERNLAEAKKYKEKINQATYKPFV
jgi:hypothetical protein